MNLRIIFIFSSMVVLATACGGGAGQAADAGPPPFVAFGASFQSFASWPSVHDDGPSLDAGFPATVLGPRTQYLNEAPPHGSTAFPIGTIIVEARADGTYFAGAKRGGGFNSAGAKDWEWFELVVGTDGAVSILWRGVGPPPGDTYGGDPDGCNHCHESCAANDYVCSPELQLSSF